MTFVFGACLVISDYGIYSRSGLKVILDGVIRSGLKVILDGVIYVNSGL